MQAVTALLENFKPEIFKLISLFQSGAQKTNQYSWASLLFFLASLLECRWPSKWVEPFVTPCTAGKGNEMGLNSLIKKSANDFSTFQAFPLRVKAKSFWTQSGDKSLLLESRFWAIMSFELETVDMWGNGLKSNKSSCPACGNCWLEHGEAEKRNPKSVSS